MVQFCFRTDVHIYEQRNINLGFVPSVSGRSGMEAFMYWKEMIYLGLYKNGERQGNAGFLKVEQRNGDGRMTVSVKNLPRTIDGKYAVRYYSGSDWKETEEITLRDGCGQWERREADSLEQVRLQIMLPGGYRVEGVSKNAAEKRQPEAATAAATEERQPELAAAVVSGQEPSERRLPESESAAAAMPEGKLSRSTVAVAADRKQPERRLSELESAVASERRSSDLEPRILTADTLSVESLKEDKWAQILDTYDNIHPYADERVYVKLEPKDFIILSGKYQHLVHNSFLLHGFYNYRHIALGKEGEGYVLGVPGVFYEREKMVALMFGFEAFECEGGEPKAGGFGYYLRQVEL